jgi:preprotein translocase subunit SecF
MRRVINFSRMFVPAAVLSALLIAGGIVSFFVVGGFNLGVDFQAGIVQEVQFAPTAFTLAWNGEGNATISSDSAGMHIMHFGPGMESRSLSFFFADHGTAGEIAAAMSQQLEGLTASFYASTGTPSSWLTRGALADPLLGSAPQRVHFLNPQAAEIPIAEVREVMEASLGQIVVVQNMGQPSDRHFLIRVRADDEAQGAIPAEGITGILEAHFGQGEVVVLRSDFVGSRFAGHLTDQIGVLIAATLLLVLAYATIRFRLQYAVGAVLGIIHDGIIVAAFVVVTGMEFNTTTIAAILTILGYSTNNTIVVFDRIRENRRLYPEEPFIDILNRSLSETLNRTIITTVTTMLAVLSLFIFTTGAMQDFALALMVGMVSGVYTTTFIVTSFMNFWENQKVKKEKAKMGIAVAQGKPTLSKA